MIILKGKQKKADWLFRAPKYSFVKMSMYLACPLTQLTICSQRQSAVQAHKTLLDALLLSTLHLTFFCLPL